jgi:histidyl-tRNA synthetase
MWRGGRGVKMKTQTVKGFQDFAGMEARKRAKIVEIIRRQFELYGFEPSETPVVEFEEFVRGENSGDDAVRDVFKLEDRGKRKLALRYEFTFQLKRLAKNQKLPYKRFQIGVVFRDEPVREGRSRQFIQCDIDTVGSSVKDEAEILAVVDGVFKKLGVSIKIYVNNRKLFNEVLVSEGVEEKNREQVIRELDKLDKLSKKEVADNLKKFGAEKVLRVFMGKEKDFEKYNFYKEIRELKKYCRGYGVRVEFRPFLARGLSYYNGSVFEIWSKELNVSLAGGGSYLVGDVQACGVALGLEPICLLSKIEGDAAQVQVVSIDEDSVAVDLAGKLREKGISVNLVLDKSVGKALEYANAKGVGKVVFVGKEEVAKGKFKVRDMVNGKEEFLSEDKVLGLFG